MKPLCAILALALCTSAVRADDESGVRGVVINRRIATPFIPRINVGVGYGAGIGYGGAVGIGGYGAGIGYGGNFAAIGNGCCGGAVAIQQSICQPVAIQQPVFAVQQPAYGVGGCNNVGFAGGYGGVGVVGAGYGGVGVVGAGYGAVGYGGFGAVGVRFVGVRAGIGHVGHVGVGVRRIGIRR